MAVEEYNKLLELAKAMENTVKQFKQELNSHRDASMLEVMYDTLEVSEDVHKVIMGLEEINYGT